MAEPTTLYKVMALQLLSAAGFDLSHTQITDFFTDYGYTDYFTIQPVIHELSEAGLIEANETHTTTYYSITADGERTRSALLDRITFAIDSDINKYLKENRLRMKQENSLTADFDKAVDGGYFVHCVAAEDGKDIMDITLRASTREQAEAICYNWRIRYNEVYASIMDELTR